MRILRALAALGLSALSLGACEGPTVLPALTDDDGATGGETPCTEYCGDAAGCDRDCVHVCEIGRTLCPTEWDAALACRSEEASCDHDFGLPVAPAGCEEEFSMANDCAPLAACAVEQSFELCDACCATWENDGALVWQRAFHDCACASCASECGSLYCGTDSGGEVECGSCTERFCADEVTSACHADERCYRYDVCVAGCPTDDSSHCSEHPTFDACSSCCVAEFTEGAARFDELLRECACGPCEADCYDSDICQGFDLTTARCNACIESSCEATFVEVCGGEPRCNSFMACTAACP